MDNTESVVQEMNKFLRGIHMGATTFKDYLERVSSPKVKDELVKVIESFKRHEEVITKRINQMHGDATDTLGIMGIMGEFFEKMKLIPVDTDKEVVEHAIKAMNMGIDNANKFIYEHENLEESLMNDVRGVVRDYDNHLRKLIELRDTLS